MPHDSENKKTAYVWDKFVRGFHWLLLVCIGVSLISGYLLGATWLQLHYIAGTVAVTLVATRVLWGGLGPTYARFSSFITSTKTLRDHFDALRAGTASRHLGHNPLGALMVLALLASVLGLGLTGTIALGGIFKVGPLAFMTSFKVGSLVSYAHAFLATVLMWLIGAHIAGALFESFRTRENLPKSMVTGRKQIRVGDHAAPAKKAKPIMMTLVLIPLLGGTAYGLTNLASKPGLGVPAYPLNKTYAAECSECHIAYHPSLLSTVDWQNLMATLPNHFGEDASLDPATVSELTDWLTANASETADTKPAHVLSLTNPAKPFALTETKFWIATHQAVPAATFSRPPIFAKSNCAACHQDTATGRYLPTNIEIPRKPTS